MKNLSALGVLGVVARVAGSFLGALVAHQAAAQPFAADEFVWSYSGPIPGRHCVRINEPSAPARHHWDDNYLCSNSDWAIEWSFRGPVADRRCTQVNEPSSPAWRDWDDNHLCVPTDSPLVVFWSFDGPKRGLNCVKANEPSEPRRNHWDDNYFCFEKDTDGDGLFDSWETAGIDIDGDGRVELELASLGADPRHKNIFVEIDYFACSEGGSGCDASSHSDRPSADAIALVVNAFANAPVPNPDGRSGIDLVVLVDDAVPHRAENCSFPSDCFFPLAGRYQGKTTERAGSAANFRQVQAARRVSMHYALWVHRITGGYLGQAFLWGGNFVVTPNENALGGERSSPLFEAITFMHELGHNLNLRHGGGDDRTCKPNYHSVMNDFGSVFIYDPIDYSRGLFPRIGYLDERRLDEAIGIEDGPIRVPFGDGVSRPRTARGDGPIDWNHNGSIDRGFVSANIDAPNDYWCLGRELARIRGFDDWANLRYRLYGTSLTGGVIRNRESTTVPAEPTQDIVNSMRKETFKPTTVDNGGNQPKRYLKIRQTFGANLDGNVSTAHDADDIWFQAVTAEERYITPLNGTRLHHMAFERPCRADFLSDRRISISMLKTGSRICVKTNRGNLFELTLLNEVGPSPGVLGLSYRWVE